MHIMSKAILGTAIGTGLLAMSVMSASADMACTGNVCWHVHSRYHYPPAAHVVVHPDTWHMTKKYVIREHAGPGYWHGHSWVTIR